MRQDGPGHADQADDVDVEDALRLGDGAFPGGAGGAGTGVAGQDIDAPDRPITCRATAPAGSSPVTSRPGNVTPSRGVTREVLRLVPATWKPAAASASAAASPMPEDTPVTSAAGRVAVSRDSWYY